MEVVWDETWLRYNTTIRTCTHHTYHIALDNKSSILAGDLPHINGFSEIPIYNKLHILQIVLFLVSISSLSESLSSVSLVGSLSLTTRKKKEIYRKLHDH